MRPFLTFQVSMSSFTCEFRYTERTSGLKLQISEASA